jgi:hypothetical protein
MDGHISHANLRTYLDRELPAAEQALTEQHLAGCPDCRVRLQAVSERAALVGARLSSLAPNPVEGPRSAAVVLSQVKQKQQKEKVPMFKSLLGKRPLWAGVSAIVVLAVAFSFAPVQAWASEFLGLFRVQHVQVLPIDTTQLSSLSNDSTLAKQISQLFSDSVTVTRQPGDPVVEPDAATASQAAGFNVRLLGAGQGTPRLTVTGGTAFELVINRQRAQALLNEAGRSDLQLPASVDGAKVSINIPAGATAAYGDCTPVTSSSKNPVGALRHGVSMPNADCTMLAEVPSPTVDTPPDLNIAQLAEIGLQFTGMTAAQAHQFSQSVDWTSTLVIPFPRNAGTYEQVSVDGVNGTLISRLEGGADAHYSLIWVKNGIIYGLAGTGTAQQATTLANSMQ